MKLSEMNKMQRIVAEMSYERCNWVIGGYENVLEDCEPTSEDYKAAENALANHEGLVQEVYESLMHKTERGWHKAVRFVGKEFMLERINGRIKRLGY